MQVWSLPEFVGTTRRGPHLNILQHFVWSFHELIKKGGRLITVYGCWTTSASGYYDVSITTIHYTNPKLSMLTFKSDLNTPKKDDKNMQKRQFCILKCLCMPFWKCSSPFKYLYNFKLLAMSSFSLSFDLLCQRLSTMPLAVFSEWNTLLPTHYSHWR